MTPESPEIQYPLWKEKLRKGAVWLPHGKLSNSPGNPAWDTTGGKFGVHQGQVFIGDQTLSTMFRIVTEKVNGEDQGCVVPFARGMSSGVMRPVFLPDGSLLVGQTGRGWASTGGSLLAMYESSSRFRKGCRKSTMLESTCLSRSRRFLRYRNSQRGSPSRSMTRALLSTTCRVSSRALLSSRNSPFCRSATMR